MSVVTGKGGRYNVAVIGGGAGGFAAAWTAARRGASVVLIEKADTLGGNGTRGGVNVWEPVAGATGVPRDLYERLREIPGACGIYTMGRHFLWFDAAREKYPFPGGELVIDPARSYEDTLHRSGTGGIVADSDRVRRQWHGVIFEPAVMSELMQRVLDETRCVRTLLNRSFVNVEHDCGRVRAVTLDDGQRIEADWFIDGTADGLLCVAAGCETRVGREARSVFGEPGAPEVASDHINGVTQIFRATRADRPGIEALPVGMGEVGESCWWQPKFPYVSMFHYPNGDLNFNMLPTMEGREFAALGYQAAVVECRRRVMAQWHYLQREFDEFQQYKLAMIAPALGVRETRRIVCEYTLTQHDLLAGLSGQKHSDIVAIADHAMDTHGQGHGTCGELREPYGVPLRCLIPKGFTNLFIACRAAGFSAIAASSCRLTRTMMQLGQAAAEAAIRLGI